jgi:hypothetical protein
MDKLSKAQKDEYATAFSILALYDAGVSDFIVPMLDLWHGTSRSIAVVLVFLLCLSTL